MLNLNINKKDSKYKNLFNQGIEFVYENDDIPTDTVFTNEPEEPEEQEVKEDKKNK